MQPSASKPVEPLAMMLADDGVIPNNPTLPLLFCRAAIKVTGRSDPEGIIEAVFQQNGWGNSLWRNGIYPYVHYHSMIHEVMGVSRGRAKVRFGGAAGRELDLIAGDVVVLPAGTGHQCLWADPNLMVIGAYPAGGQYNLCRSSRSEHAEALKTIPQVPLPDTDPVFGPDGPLKRLWQRPAP
jgi:uncharacterized protein YjlB